MQHAGDGLVLTLLSILLSAVFSNLFHLYLQDGELTHCVEKHRKYLLDFFLNKLECEHQYQGQAYAEISPGSTSIQIYFNHTGYCILVFGYMIAQ